MDIGGIKVIGTGSRLLTAEDVTEVTKHIEQLESENAKLRNEVDNLLDFEHLTSVAVAYAGCDECGEYKQTMLRLFAENAKLRELIYDFIVDEERGHNDDVTFREHVISAHECGIAQGIEV